MSIFRNLLILGFVDEELQAEIDAGHKAPTNEEIIKFLEECQKKHEDDKLYVHWDDDELYADW